MRCLLVLSRKPDADSSKHIMKLIFAFIGITALASHLAWASPFQINQGVFGGNPAVPANPSSGFGQSGWGNPWDNGPEKPDQDNHKPGPGGPGWDDDDKEGPGRPDWGDIGGPLGPGPPSGAYQGPLNPEEAMLYQTVAQASLSGFEETPPLCTDCRGDFSAWIPWDGDRIEWELEVWGCDTIPTSAALHMGLPGNEGPVVAKLCSDNAENRELWDCGRCELHVDDDFDNDDFKNRNRLYLKGTIRAEDIKSTPSSNLDSEDLDCFIKAMQFRSPTGQSALYVEVETQEFPQGELRGQLLPRNFSPIFRKGHGDDGLGKHKLAEKEGFNGFK